MERRSNCYVKLAVALVASVTCGFSQTGAYANPQQAPPQQPPPPGYYSNNPNPQPPPQGPAPGAPMQAEMPRPGSLNYVQGQVSADGQALTPQAIGHFALQPKQTLATGNGYAEVLLTPGAYLRVGPNSEFRMPSVGLSDARVNLTRGNALIEVDQLIEGTHLETTIGTTSVDLLKKGLYGFSANPPEVRVFDGKAQVIALSKKHDIGKGDQILLANNPELKKTGFDEKQAKLDQLYVWSEARSRDEAAQNKAVAQNASGYFPAGDGWFWDPYADYYGFWPSDYLYSPFGFGFYGGFYPGFYVGYYGGYHHGFFHGWHGGGHGFVGVHGNGVGGFHGGGFHGGGFHGGGGHGGGGHR